MAEPQQQKKKAQGGSAQRADGEQVRVRKVTTARSTVGGTMSGRVTPTAPASPRSRIGGVPVSGGVRRIAIDSDAPAVFASTGPVSRLVAVLGNNTLAAIVGVSRSQPSRWKQGTEQPGPESRRRLSDLDHVLDRLLMELYPDQVGAWLTSPNPQLAGARPVDVLELRGAAAVLPAIDALAQGAFA